MKFSKNVDMVVNIVWILFIVLLVWVIGICMYDGDKLMEGVGQILDNMPKDGNSPGAGYELLGVLFAGVFSSFAGIAFFLAAMFFGFIALILLIMVIIAFSRRKKYNNTNNPIFIRKNLTAKMVFSIIMVILVGTSVLGNDISVAGVIYLIVLVGLLVLIAKARNVAKAQTLAFEASNQNYAQAYGQPQYGAQPYGQQLYQGQYQNQYMPSNNQSTNDYNNINQ